MTVQPAIQSEQMIIGALFLEPELLESIRIQLCPLDFADVALQKIYAAILIVQKKRGVFDIAMVADELEIPSDPLCELSNNCFSTKNIKAHADIVREKSVQRQLLICEKQVNCDHTFVLLSDDPECLKCHMTYEQHLDITEASNGSSE